VLFVGRARLIRLEERVEALKANAERLERCAAHAKEDADVVLRQAVGIDRKLRVLMDDPRVERLLNERNLPARS
jgi:hypothetical protein